MSETYEFEPKRESGSAHTYGTYLGSAVSLGLLIAIPFSIWYLHNGQEAEARDFAQSFLYTILVLFVVVILFTLYSSYRVQVHAFIKGVRSGMEKIGHLLAKAINSVLLLFVYVIGVGITSMIAKVAKKKFLDLEVSESRESYWEDLNLGKEEKQNYYRQF